MVYDKPSAWRYIHRLHYISSRAALCHGPLARYVKLRVANASGIPGTFFPPPRVIDPDIHHDKCVTHVPWCIPGSLTSSFLWRRWRGKRSGHSRRMRNQQLYVSGKRPMHYWWYFIASPGLKCSGCDMVNIFGSKQDGRHHVGSILKYIMMKVYESRIRHWFK